MISLLLQEPINTTTTKIQLTTTGALIIGIIIGIIITLILLGIIKAFKNKKKKD